MWKKELQPESSAFVIRHGQFRLSVSQKEADRSWQHLCLSFGRHTTEPPELATTTWPREAIAIARQYLDNLEAALCDDEATP